MRTCRIRFRPALAAAGGLALVWQASFLVVPFRAGRQACAPALVSVWQGDDASVRQSALAPGTAGADPAGILAPAGCGTVAAGRMADHGGLAALVVVVLVVLDITGAERRQKQADRPYDGSDRVDDGGAEAEPWTEVFAFDPEDDEPVGEPVEHAGQGNGIAGAEPVGAGRSADHAIRSAAARVDLYPVHVAGGGGVRVHGVDDDGNRTPGPQVEEPGGFAIVLDGSDAR